MGGDKIGANCFPLRLAGRADCGRADGRPIALGGSLHRMAFHAARGVSSPNRDVQDVLPYRVQAWNRMRGSGDGIDVLEDGVERRTMPRIAIQSTPQIFIEVLFW